jgi:hypothetical protein
MIGGGREMMMLQTQESTIRQYTTAREFSRPFTVKKVILH